MNSVSAVYIYVWRECGGSVVWCVVWRECGGSVVWCVVWRECVEGVWCVVFGGSVMCGVSFASLGPDLSVSEQGLSQC